MTFQIGNQLAVGIKRTEEHKQKLSLLYKESGGNNWKGDKVGYPGIHAWIRTYGNKTECEFCSSKNNLDWANKSGDYKRNKEDWIRLCRKCHIKHDKRGEKISRKLKGSIPWNKGLNGIEYKKHFSKKMGRRKHNLK